MISRLLAASVAALAVLCLPGIVLAHAALVSSDPPDGDTIATPYLLRAQYDEPLTGNSRIIVRDAANNEVARGGISENDETVMEVQLDELAPGDYVARWTAVTDDGGVTRGSINFRVEAAPTASPTPSLTLPPPTAGSPSPSATAASPTPSPSATPSAEPTPAPVQPASSAADLWVALLVAGVLLAALLAFLWRRRAC